VSKRDQGPRRGGPHPTAVVVHCHATAVAGLVWPGPSSFHKNEAHPQLPTALDTCAARGYHSDDRARRGASGALNPKSALRGAECTPATWLHEAYHGR